MDRHDGLGADLEEGFADDFGCGDEGDYNDGYNDDYSDDFDEGFQDLDDLAGEQPRSESVTISVEVLRAGDDWHVLRVEEP